MGQSGSLWGVESHRCGGCIGPGSDIPLLHVFFAFMIAIIICLNNDVGLVEEDFQGIPPTATELD